MSRNENKSSKLFRLVLTAGLSALIVVMTVVPNTGYISYGSAIELTTLHIVVIVGAAFLGWKYGAVLGGVWGLTSFARAFTNPLWVYFTNPLISVLPRIIIGAVAGLLATILIKGGNKLSKYAKIALTAGVTTVLHSALVISALAVFGALGDTNVIKVFGTIIMTLVGLNGLIELVIAILIVPVVYMAIESIATNRGL